MKTPSPMYGRIKQYVPMLEWASVYNSNTFTSDAVAAIIVTIVMLYHTNFVLFEWVGGSIIQYTLLIGLIFYTIRASISQRTYFFVLRSKTQILALFSTILSTIKSSTIFGAVNKFCIELIFVPFKQREFVQ